MSEFSERLRAAMASRGVRSRDLAVAVGKSSQAVYYWTAGRNEPLPEVMKQVADFLHVDAAWLKTGKDHVMQQTQPVAVSEDVEESSDYVFIPEYHIEFGCSPSGADAPAWIPEPERKAAYRLDFFTSRGIRPEKCRRILAEGDSMEPLICDGDTVLFVEQAEGTAIRDGRVYCLSYGGALKIKRLYRKANGDLIIRSDNSAYPDEIIPNAELDGLIRIYGPVIERSGSI